MLWYLSPNSKLYRPYCDNRLLARPPNRPFLDCDVFPSTTIALSGNSPASSITTPHLSSFVDKLSTNTFEAQDRRLEPRDQRSTPQPCLENVVPALKTTILSMSLTSYRINTSKLRLTMKIQEVKMLPSQRSSCQVSRGIWTLMRGFVFLPNLLILQVSFAHSLTFGLLDLKSARSI